MTLPSIAVLLSTFNGAEHLEEQLRTILAQRGVDVRLHVRDDGSRDATASILRAAASRGEIASLVEGENIGAARSFLELVRDAGDADAYAFADQDDVWDEDKLQRALELLPPDRPAMVCTTMRYLTAGGVVSGTSAVPRIVSFRNALVENIAFGCTIVMNRAARDLLLRCTPRSLVMHDAWLYLLLTALGEVIVDPHPRMSYRIHDANALGTVPGTARHFFKHLRRLLTSRGFGFHAQAAAFQECFGSALPPDTRRILDRFVASKRSVVRRVTYAWTKDFERQTKRDDVLVRLLVIAGLY